jgi:hypothetical protein
VGAYGAVRTVDRRSRNFQELLAIGRSPATGPATAAPPNLFVSCQNQGRAGGLPALARPRPGLACARTRRRPPGARAPATDPAHCPRLPRRLERAGQPDERRARDAVNEEKHGVLRVLAPRVNPFIQAAHAHRLQAVDAVRRPDRARFGDPSPQVRPVRQRGAATRFRGDLAPGRQGAC